MPTAIAGWSGAGFLARVAILILTGLAWAARSLQEVLFHPDYWDPVSQADYLAVYAFSAAWLLSAVALLILCEVVQPRRALAIVFPVTAAACALAGVANGIEDGFGLKGFGTLYVFGAMGGWVGTIAVAILLARSPARGLAIVPTLNAVGFPLFVLGGGVLILVGWAWFAAILVRLRRQPAATTLDASARNRA